MPEFMPRVLWWIVLAPLLLLFLPFYPLFWVMCRLEAKPCPECGEKWFTELVGEWDGEQWRCSRCEHYWEVR